jgi:UDP-glucose 6-dehydrogenase
LLLKGTTVKNLILVTAIAMAGFVGTANADEIAEIEKAKHLIGCSAFSERFANLAEGETASQSKQMAALFKDAAKAILESTNTLKEMAEDKNFKILEDGISKKGKSVFKSEKQIFAMHTSCINKKTLGIAIEYLEAVGRFEKYRKQ